MGEVINGRFVSVRRTYREFTMAKTGVNIKCETETEGVSVAGRLGAYLKAGCETGGLHRL